MSPTVQHMGRCTSSKQDTVTVLSHCWHATQDAPSCVQVSLYCVGSHSQAQLTCCTHDTNIQQCNALQQLTCNLMPQMASATTLARAGCWGPRDPAVPALRHSASTADTFSKAFTKHVCASASPDRQSPNSCMSSLCSSGEPGGWVIYPATMWDGCSKSTEQ